jgi:hypothetical protein
MTQLCLLNQLKNYSLLLIFLKGTAQNGSSLFMFQKPKYWSFSKRVSIEDLLDCPNYYLFYRGQIELCELGIPISYNLDKKYDYN